MQSTNGANKLGSMINAHTDFQAALREIHGIQAQPLVSDSSGSEFPARRLATNTPGWSMAAVAEAAIEKALYNGDSQGNEESQPGALPPQRQSDRAQELEPLSVQQRCQVAAVGNLQQMLIA